MAPTTTHKRPVMRGTTVEADGETFQFADRLDALDALKFLSAPETQATFRCSWEIRLPADRLPEEIDFPGQMFGPCNAPARGTSSGWECFHGHAHVSGVPYFDEEEVLANAQAGILPPADARYMDGRAVWS